MAKNRVHDCLVPRAKRPPVPARVSNPSRHFLHARLRWRCPGRGREERDLLRAGDDQPRAPRTVREALPAARPGATRSHPGLPRVLRAERPRARLAPGQLGPAARERRPGQALHPVRLAARVHLQRVRVARRRQHAVARRARALRAGGEGSEGRDPRAQDPRRVLRLPGPGVHREAPRARREDAVREHEPRDPRARRSPHRARPGRPPGGRRRAARDG